ncbi:MAG TPA: DUF4097 family beta strand repeat-containing protein [Cyclobacteriaceae bacterium]|nr:DUF4097 family beta strand repeat-containing protein [Cyclobacteriaceae bacterium]
MKKVLITLCAFVPGMLLAQSFSEKITRELQFEKKTAASTLIILNIDGYVRVEGHSGDKVIVEVNKQIYGKTDARVEKGKAEIQLGVVDRADTIILYVQGICNDFGRQRKNNWHTKYGGWGYNWNNNCNGGECNKDYDWEMDFTIKVPLGINVLASTVNDGDIEIKNVTAYNLAENVNGSIRLENISGGGTYASTINGDVDVDYTKNPSAECRYYSLNGDVNVLFAKGLAANVGFESFNGDLFTNYENLTTMPAEMQKANKGKGVSYKLGGSRFKIGTGGVFLDFETFNGNAYIKEK